MTQNQIEQKRKPVPNTKLVIANELRERARGSLPEIDRFYFGDEDTSKRQLGWFLHNALVAKGKPIGQMLEGFSKELEGGQVRVELLAELKAQHNVDPELAIRLLHAIAMMKVADALQSQVESDEFADIAHAIAQDRVHKPENAASDALQTTASESIDEPPDSPFASLPSDSDNGLDMDYDSRYGPLDCHREPITRDGRMRKNTDLLERLEAEEDVQAARDEARFAELRGKLRSTGALEPKEAAEFAMLALARLSGWEEQLRQFFDSDADSMGESKIIHIKMSIKYQAPSISSEELMQIVQEIHAFMLNKEQRHEALLAKTPETSSVQYGLIQASLEMIRDTIAKTQGILNAWEQQKSANGVPGSGVASQFGTDYAKLINYLGSVELELRRRETLLQEYSILAANGTLGQDEQKEYDQLSDDKQNLIPKARDLMQRIIKEGAGKNENIKALVTELRGLVKNRQKHPIIYPEVSPDANGLSPAVLATARAGVNAPDATFDQVFQKPDARKMLGDLSASLGSRVAEIEGVLGSLDPTHPEFPFLRRIKDTLEGLLTEARNAVQEGEAIVDANKSKPE